MTAAIRLIVGLGNPGPQYANTRHNAGFWLADILAAQYGASFTTESRFNADLAKGRANQEPLYLLKPNTFMNLSGQAVQAALAYFKIQPEEIIVLHDELDIPTGQVKLKKGGGHAGHNGLRDIQAKIGTPDFWRLRIGIDHPRKLGLAQSVADYVLHRPAAEQMNIIEHSLNETVRLFPDILAGDTSKANRGFAQLNKSLTNEPQN